MAPSLQPSDRRHETKAPHYRARDPQPTDLYRLLLDNLETFLAHYETRYQPEHGYLRPEMLRSFEELLSCGVYQFGMARIRCRDCGHDTFVPLSCRRRGVCPLCHAKRQLFLTDRVLEQVLPDVPCRQWTFSLPKALRVFFRFDAALFKELSQLVVRELTRYVRAVTGRPELEPAFVVWDQSFGTLLDTYHPHQHICATDGGFTPEGAFVPLGKVRNKDVEALCEVLRHCVVRWLVRREKLSPDFAHCLLGWKHSGFSLDASRRVPAGRRAQLERLLGYMARHPFDPAGIRYDAAKGTVRYRAGRRHAVRKTAFIEVDALDFIAMLATHIPHARRHQVRYYGAAHPAVRHRLGLGGLPVDTDMPAVTAARGHKSWARLIWRVYGIDPLICPKCGGPREILAVIFDPESIARVLRHLDLPTDLPVQRPARSPPPEPAEQRGARSPLPPAHEDDGDDLFIDPDYSQWDGIDETFETATGQDAGTSQRQEGQPPPVDEPRSPESLLDLMKRHGGALCWADSLLEKQTPKT